MMVRPATPTDSARLAEIYNHYVAHTIVTFETEPVSAEDFARRVEETQNLGLPWLVAVADNDVIGYASASKWKGRCAYRFSVESTIYLDPARTGRGVGRHLYELLLEQIQQAGFHAVIGGISLPNEASVALHEALGFDKVGHFREVGFKFDRWIDVGYWERRFS